MDKTSGQYQKLPPGWDCKYDQATGNCYYINYFTKAMQLEDPRMRYKQLQNDRSSTESIPMQPMHGSPYHVYPSNNMPAMRAFQSGGAHNANPSLLNMSASPLLSASRGQLEMSPLPYPRTTVLQQTPRLGNMSRRSTIQETSFTNQFDTDGVVTKIQNMFPTASENHIRLLLKKYYNREAVVISALQVEKHPVTMPGPYVTPPAQRHLYHSNSAFYMTPPSRRLDIGAGNRSGGLGSSTSRTASPVPGGRFGSVMSMHSGGGYGAVAGGGGGGAGIGYGAGNAFAYAPLQFHGSPRFGEQWRSSPKPHSSPKMKLRYMKNIFPKADEMLLLDILSASDNNVQQASEKLIALGYQKRDFAALKAAQKSTTHGLEAPKKKPGDEQIIPLRPKEHTTEEKEAMRQMLKSRYPQIAERIIIMALESVNYAEDRAIQILQIVQDEDEARAKKHAAALQLVPMPDHAELDGITAEAVVAGHDATDNIITVVLETADGSVTNAAAAETTTTTEKCKLPIINLTTPTTATTQIILSQTPICIDNDAQPSNIENTINDIQPSSKPAKSDSKDNEIKKRIKPKKSSTSTTSSSSSSSSTSSSSQSHAQSPYSFEENNKYNKETSTFKRITTKEILSQPKHANSIEIGISDYLHGIGKGKAIKSFSTSFSSAVTSSTSTSSTSTSSSTSILDTLKLSRSRSRDKSDSLKQAQRDSTEANDENAQQNEFKSLLGRIATMGHNTELVRGPDENLLLADYVTWNGANPDMPHGQKSVPIGADTNKLSERNYVALGRNPDLCKGAKSGLAKGSIYAQLAASSGGKSTNIKCK